MVARRIVSAYRRSTAEVLAACGIDLLLAAPEPGPEAPEAHERGQYVGEELVGGVELPALAGAPEGDTAVQRPPLSTIPFPLV